MKGMTIMLDERDLTDLKDAARRMALPPSVYARSLLLRALRAENAMRGNAEEGSA